MKGCDIGISWDVITLPLFMETFTFFFEAIFLGIYLYTLDQFEKQKKHFLLLIPVAIKASFSALFITNVKAFVNAPRGFNIVNEEFVNVNPPLYIHYLFDIMVIIVIWMTLLSGVFWLGVQRGWKLVSAKWFR